jgi:predicted acyltransferase
MTNKRNLSIDLFRGLVMFLMVAVNDFWKIPDVPHFLEHFGTHEDGMGVSDIVFPMFLFAMGMSVPLAIDRRFVRGLPVESTLGHILSRTFALLVMGSFIVNSEGEMAPLLGYGEGLYWLLMVAGFFLVWNHYPEGFRARRWFQGAGIGVLLFLAITFRTSDGGLFRASWWGILGLIGWMYLFTAVAYLLLRKKPDRMMILWLALGLLNVLVGPLREGGTILGGRNWIADFADALHIGNGHGAWIAVGGACLTLADRRFQGRTPRFRLSLALGTAAVIALLGLLSHRWFIISKNLGTAPWCLYVTAISVALYAVLRVLERHGWTRWGIVIRPAGTATLTVYMIPYILTALWVFLDPVYPDWLSGWAGVAKCFLYSFLCIGVTALLERIGLKLKI